jgi:hypothetical protein
MADAMAQMVTLSAAAAAAGIGPTQPTRPGCSPDCPKGYHQHFIFTREAYPGPAEFLDALTTFTTKNPATPVVVTAGGQRHIYEPCRLCSGYNPACPHAEPQ